MQYIVFLTVTYPNSRANKSTSNTISKTTSHAASTRYPVSTSRDDEAIEALRRQLERYVFNPPQYASCFAQVEVVNTPYCKHSV